MAVLQDVLAPSVVTGIVSRIFTPGDVLQRQFGFEIGGRGVKQVTGRAYSYDIFDNVRDIAEGRAPGVGPSTYAPNPVGKQNQTIPRSYEKMILPEYELLMNIRTLGKNAGVRDRMGAAYLDSQGVVVRRRQNNFREFQTAMFLSRGAFSFRFDGDRWIPVVSLGANQGFTIDFQIPSGNKSNAIPGLNPLGTGNIIDVAWSNAAANIPGHIDSINQAFQQLVGAPLAVMITDSIGWNYVISNTKLQSQSGSVNAVYAEYDMERMRGPDGNLLGIFRGRLKARPWVEWWIFDQGLNIDGTYTRFWDGTMVTAMIQPDPYWFAAVEGSEPQKDNPMTPAVERFGFHSWLREWDEPARVEWHSLQNFLIECRIPKAIMQFKVA
jgi:hypothetical protein